MTKTTIYLPDDLKQAIAGIAAASGRSEAEVIREAIRTLVRRSDRPRPRGGLFASGDPGLARRVDEALAGFGER
jgi:metal-responsive CopG/Arc/MetJ family transcriptional regulator